MLFHVKTTSFTTLQHIFAPKLLYAMSRMFLVMALSVSCSHLLHGQEHDGIDEIMLFLGLEDPQDLEQEEVERLSALLENKVNINNASASDLYSCGLFTPYQVAVLDDHRSRHGGLASFLELSLLDGFSEAYVRKVRPFIILERPSALSEGKVLHELAARTGYRWREDEGNDGNYALKYRMDVKGRYAVSAAVARGNGADGWYPSSIAGGVSWNLGKRGSRLIAGDFNARFGQGLTLWSGSFLTGLTTPDTFMKKPSGISQTWSFTGSSAFSGVASVVMAGPFAVSSMVAFPGIKDVLENPGGVGAMPALNVSWTCRHGQLSMTSVAVFSSDADERQVRTGLDGAFCVKGVNIFGEMSVDWAFRKMMAVAGTRFGVGEHMDLAFQFRAYQGEQFGAAVGGEFSSGRNLNIYGREGFGSSRRMHMVSFAVDASYYPVSKDVNEPWSLQVKSQFVWDMLLTPSLQLKMRISERLRTWGLPFRTDLRADVMYNIHPFAATLRLNVLKSDGMGMLSYLEGSYTHRMLTLHVRQGIFLIDDWDDRIYVYERDAPGSFNSPAMYGRGLWTSAAAALKISRRIRLYMRAAFTAYPLMEEEKKKPGKAELKLQIQFRF